MKNPESGIDKKSYDTSFPVRWNLNMVYVNTVILLFLMLSVSIIGILFQKKVYQSEELSVIFVPNDILNIAVGVPIILISMFLTLRKKLIGLLCYPGALFYVTYIYTTYLLGLAFNILFLPYLILITLSIYSIIGLVLSIDNEQVQLQLKAKVPIRTAGYILFTLACILLINQFYQIVSTLINHTEVNQMMIAQWIVDFVIATPPVMIIGYLMIQRKALGYSMGISLLLLLSVLFIGLVPVLIIKANLTDTPIEILDILIVSVSSMICFIPFVLFARGIIRASG